jgi:hypothetical protein
MNSIACADQWVTKPLKSHLVSFSLSFSELLDRSQRIRITLVVGCLVGVTVGCGPPKAPAMKRALNDEQLDEHYLKDVFIPSYADQSSSSPLKKTPSLYI